MMAEQDTSPGHVPATEVAGCSAGGPAAYFALLKPRVMSLSIFTAFVGMLAAPGHVENWPLALIALLAIALGAGACGALNMWWDADIDAQMVRTKARPIPRGLVPRSEAAGLGVLLTFVSVGVLAISTNFFAALLLAYTIFFYVVIYSILLKRSTPQNIVIGGIAGALPPVVGWAAMTGSAPLEAWLLCVLIFFWTPAHFWALALVKHTDYALASIPMLPNVAGAAATRRQIFIYSVITSVVGVCPVAFGVTGWMYGAVAVVMGIGFVWLSYQLRRDISAPDQSQPAARRLFVFSIAYLFVLFAVIIVEQGVGIHGW